jgi:hypothetical protein
MSSSTDPASKRLKADVIVIPSFGQSFAPKATLPRTYGKETINVYPTGDYDLAEKAYAFTRDKNTLDNSSISKKSQITLMGELHNGTTTVVIKLKHFRAITSFKLKDPSNLTVLSYHKEDGTAINGCIDPDTNIIKPIINGPAADCRPADIMYARVKAIIDLSALDAKLNPKISMVYFLRLPMSNNTVTRNNRPTIVNTFNGPSNWTTTSPIDFVTLIYNHPDSIEELFHLQSPAFASPEAVINRVDKGIELEKKIVDAAYPSIMSDLFEQRCPNFYSDPAHSLNQVKQENEKDKTVIPVTIYYEAFLQLLGLLDTDTNYSFNPLNAFVQNLSVPIRKEMEKQKFKAHLLPSSLAPNDQLNLLRLAHNSAVLAESALNETKQLIRNEVDTFHAMTGQVLNSTADRTIAHHRNGAKSDDLPNPCWGCESPDHPFYSTKLKKVVCPRAHEPAVAERALKARERYASNRRKRYGKPRASTTSAGGTQDNAQIIRAITASSANPEQKTALIMSIMSPGKSSESKNSAKSNTFVLLGIITVLNASRSKPQLEIPIHPMLPTINLLIGTGDSSFIPAIPVMLDSGASLCIGYSGYILAIAKAYPFLVKSIVHANDDRSPITLSGAVSSDKDTPGSQITTDLPVVVEFFMPLFTKTGEPTSVKVACGPGVSVNFIVGLSFIKSAGLSIDFNDGVVESKTLDCDPWHITYKIPSRGAPNLLPTDQDSKKILTAHQANIVLAIQRAETFLSSIDKEEESIPVPDPTNIPTETTIIGITEPEPANKKVKFNFEAGTSEFTAIVSGNED